MIGRAENFRRRNVLFRRKSDDACHTFFVAIERFFHVLGKPLLENTDSSEVPVGFGADDETFFGSSHPTRHDGDQAAANKVFPDLNQRYIQSDTVSCDDRLTYGGDISHAHHSI